MFFVLRLFFFPEIFSEMESVSDEQTFPGKKIRYLCPECGSNAVVSLWGPLWVSLFYILLDDFFGFKLTSGFSSSVQKPLKVPSLARSMQKPLNVPSLAQSVPKPLKMDKAQAC